AEILSKKKGRRFYFPFDLSVCCHVLLEILGTFNGFFTDHGTLCPGSFSLSLNKGWRFSTQNACSSNDYLTDFLVCWDVVHHIKHGLLKNCAQTTCPCFLFKSNTSNFYERIRFKLKFNSIHIKKLLILLCNRVLWFS